MTPLKIKVGDGAATLLASNLRTNTLADQCEIAGLNSFEVFVVCEGKTIRAFDRTSGAARLLFEADIIEGVSATLVNETLYLIHDRECLAASPDCFLTEPTLRALNTSGGIPTTMYNLGLVHITSKATRATQNRIIIEGSPKGRFSLSERSILETPLFTGAAAPNVTFVAADGDFLATDQVNAYYEANGMLVKSARTDTPVGPSVSPPTLPALASCAPNAI